ncbi:putative DNA topoisomerase (ATP-hydrolyzing) [Helianthus annuus]|uniref:DNA topoisomerase (ATP-hydrolyzing) n=1 Tax=Helianthus annuus TaxID=4232 RepID=A0A9K3EMD7_HELAN|nr:putative DNA topoisomerase (ATP-hydrolyzing) [Helianthus annuus]
MPPLQNPLKPDSFILSTLKTLTAATKSASTSKTLTLTDLSTSLSSNCREVSDLPLSSVQNRILTLALNLTKSILAGNGFSFSVPSRAATNQLYVICFIPRRSCFRTRSNPTPFWMTLVVGRLVFSDNGDMIDCTKMGIGGNDIVICVYGVSRFEMLICKRFAYCCDYLFIIKISIHKLFPA